MIEDFVTDHHDDFFFEFFSCCSLLFPCIIFTIILFICPQVVPHAQSLASPTSSQDLSLCPPRSVFVDKEEAWLVLIATKLSSPRIWPPGLCACLPPVDTCFTAIASPFFRIRGTVTIQPFIFDSFFFF